MTKSSPKTVFIMGGGSGSAAREVLKHKDIERVIICEIDRVSSLGCFTEKVRLSLLNWSYLLTVSLCKCWSEFNFNMLNLNFNMLNDRKLSIDAASIWRQITRHSMTRGFKLFTMMQREQFPFFDFSDPSPFLFFFFQLFFLISTKIVLYFTKISLMEWRVGLRFL